MRARIFFVGLALLACAVAGWFASEFRSRFAPPTDNAADAEEQSHHHAGSDRQRVRLSPQARANLHLDVQPAYPQSYWQTIRLPGTVCERRGQGDRGVTAPAAGVVREVLAVPGDTVRPGDALFVLGLTSESLQTSQTDLHRTAQELRIANEQKDRLDKIAESISGARLIDLRNQIHQLVAMRKARRNELSLRGLTTEQIDRAEQGDFIKELVVRAPPVRSKGAASDAVAAPLFELEELRAELGEQVQAGQVLARLAHHESLAIEGRGFKEEAALIGRAAAQGWPLEADFAGDAEGDWPTPTPTLAIQYLANTLDPASQTFPFYVPLVNQFREYTRDGKTYRLWRYRPGQRVRLGVRIREFRGVFVLPIEAVVRDGPDAYVFRQNGATFERRPVHVVFDDGAHVAFADDGSVPPGSYLARGGAAALDRAAKVRPEGEGHGHDHGHSHDH